jgi:hypothetical protein
VAAVVADLLAVEVVPVVASAAAVAAAAAVGAVASGSVAVWVARDARVGARLAAGPGGRVGCARLPARSASGCQPITSSLPVTADTLAVMAHSGKSEAAWLA